MESAGKIRFSSKAGLLLRQTHARESFILCLFGENPSKRASTLELWVTLFQPHLPRKSEPTRSDPGRGYEEAHSNTQQQDVACFGTAVELLGGLHSKCKALVGPKGTPLALNGSEPGNCRGVVPHFFITLQYREAMMADGGYKLNGTQAHTRINIITQASRVQCCNNPKTKQQTATMWRMEQRQSSTWARFGTSSPDSTLSHSLRFCFVEQAGSAICFINFVRSINTLKLCVHIQP